MPLPCLSGLSRTSAFPERSAAITVSHSPARRVLRLCKLSVWWLRLGIGIERIKPAHPEQNGRHERMHLTLKKEATKPPARTSCSSRPLRSVHPDLQPRAAPSGPQHATTRLSSTTLTAAL